MHRRGRVHLRVLAASGRRSPSSAVPQRGDSQLRRASPVGGRPRLEAALAVGPVELEAHRSPAWRTRASASIGRCRRPRRRSPASRVSSVRCVAVLPEEHLLGEARPRCENSAPTDLAAVDALDRLADERRDRQRRDLAAAACAPGSGIGVGQDDLAQRSSRDPVDRRVAQHAVGGAGVDLGHALALERADDLDQRAGRVDLVVDDDRALAAGRRR